jgi:hypothetical protein
MFSGDTYARHGNQDIGIALPTLPVKSLRNTARQSHAPTASCRCTVDTLPASATDILSPVHISPLHLPQNVVSIKCFGGDNQEGILAKRSLLVIPFLLGYLIMNQDFFYTEDCKKKIGF